MKKIILLLFLYFCIISSLSAQSDKIFKFPKDFAKNNYLPHSIIFKYKSQQTPNSQAKNASTNQNIQTHLVEKLGIKALKPCFAKDHSVFSPHKNKKKIAERTQKLALIHTLDIQESFDLETAINLLRKDPAIEYAEPIYTNFQALIVPNDPLAQPNATQYHLNQVKAYSAWDIETGNSSMVIGIVDNVFDLTNPDLQGNDLAPAGFKRDVADFDNNLNASGASHGSFVAMCASAIPNNTYGGAGTGYNCRFLPIKVSSDANINAYFQMNSYTGILVAAQQTGVKVINLSWGRTGGESSFEYDILQTVYEDYDVVMVAAAGNDNNQNYYFPASYDDFVVSVAATNASDAKAGFSSYNVSVDISAPGENIVTALGTSDGTSYASPIVAGAVGLIRNKYPMLKASQVIARLKSTTDYIDNITANRNYQGKLGVGRLNMLRAVSDPLMAVSLQNYQFATNLQGWVYRGFTSDLQGGFKNHLNALTNLNITLSTSSPYIDVIDNQSIIGNINTNTAFNNQTDPFKIKVADNTPANTIVLFKLTYQADNYTFTEELRIMVNPGQSLVNQAWFNVNDMGNLGIYDNSYFELSGMTYAKTSGANILFAENMLKEAGLMVGISADSVSSAVRGSLGQIEQNFTIKSSLVPTNHTANYWETTSIYEDKTNNSLAIGLEITQKTYAWNETGLDKAVIVEYNIKNISSQTFNNLFAGIFANWDIIISSENIADWDASRSLGYVYDPNLSGLYGGIQLLTDIPNKAQPTTKFSAYYAVDNASTIANDTIVNLSDGFSKAEKYKVISNQTKQTKAGTGNGKDVSHSLASKISNLQPGRSQSIAFAFIVGDDLLDLQKSADSVKSRFLKTKQSPIPNLTTSYQVCKGENLKLKPINGTTFNFYLENPKSQAINPIYSGNELVINDLQVSQTYYVSNVDSVYESNPTIVNIAVGDYQTNFDFPANEVDMTKTVNLTDKSRNPDQWTWKITRQTNSNVNDFAFVENSTANSQNPKVKFNNPGTYQVKLISKSQNCADSLSKSLFVYFDVATGISEYLSQNLKVFPNPSEGELKLSLPEWRNTMQVSISDNLGRIVYTQQIENTSNLVNSLNINQLSNGIYFLKLQEKSGYVVKKLVIRK